MSSIEYRQRLREKEENTQTGRLSTFRQVKTEEPAEVATVTDPAKSTESAVETPPTPARTPEQLREQAAAAAAQMMELDGAEYDAEMQRLYSEDETLYAVVCDEIENLAAAEEEVTDDEIGQSQIDAEATTGGEESQLAAEEPRTEEEQAVIDQEADDIIATEDYLKDDGGAE